MNDTLTTPDPAAQVAEVREIIQHRGGHSCEAVLIRVRRVVFPPADEAELVDRRPIATNERGWPRLSTEGTAWERHDDPSVEP